MMEPPRANETKWADRFGWDDEQRLLMLRGYPARRIVLHDRLRAFQKRLQEPTEHEDMRPPYDLTGQQCV